MTAPAAAVRRRSALGPLISYTLRACFPTKRRIGMLVPCAGAVLFGLLSLAIHEPREVAFTRIASGGIFGLIVPLAALVIGDAVLGAEIRAGTFHFTWMSPVRMGELVVARWLGGCIVAFLTLVPACALAALAGGSPAAAWPAALAAAVASISYVAVFVAVGCIAKRAAVVVAGDRVPRRAPARRRARRASPSGRRRGCHARSSCRTRRACCRRSPATGSPPTWERSCACSCSPPSRSASPPGASPSSNSPAPPTDPPPMVFAPDSGPRGPRSGARISEARFKRLDRGFTTLARSTTRGPSPTTASPRSRARIGVPQPHPQPPHYRVPNEDAFRHVAEAYGDDNPLWCDPDYAPSHRVGRADRAAAPRSAATRSSARTRSPSSTPTTTALLQGRPAPAARTPSTRAASASGGRRCGRACAWRAATRSSACTTRGASSPSARCTSGPAEVFAARDPDVVLSAQYRLMIRTERDEGREARQVRRDRDPPVHRRASSRASTTAYADGAGAPARRRAALVGGRRGGRRDRPAREGPAARHRHGRAGTPGWAWASTA